jgi:dUTP pyrophosphatase
MDIKAIIDVEMVCKPDERALVKTSRILKIPAGYEAKIRPRSGLALNKRIKVLNSRGTMDADYRGDVCIIAINM